MGAVSNWTEEVLEHFRELLERKTMSFSEVAAALNKRFGTKFTKNSCIGKAGRLRIETRPRVPRPVRRPEPRPVPSGKPTPHDYTDIEAHPYRCPIADLTEGACRWPLGPLNQPSELFCGSPDARLTPPYCPEHSAIAYQVRPARRF